MRLWTRLAGIITVAAVTISGAQASGRTDDLEEKMRLFQYVTSLAYANDEQIVAIGTPHGIEIQEMEGETIAWLGVGYIYSVDVVDEEGGVLIASSNRGVYRIPLDEIPTLGDDYLFQRGFQASDVARDPDQGYWIGTGSAGILHYNDDSDVSVRYTTADGIPSDNVTTVAVTGDGRIWAGTPNGMGVYDGVGWIEVRELRDLWIYEIVEDRERAQVVVGTSGGIFIGDLRANGEVHNRPDVLRTILANLVGEGRYGVVVRIREDESAAEQLEELSGIIAEMVRVDISEAMDRSVDVGLIESRETAVWGREVAGRVTVDVKYSDAISARMIESTGKDLGVIAEQKAAQAIESQYGSGLSEDGAWRQLETEGGVVLSMIVVGEDIVVGHRGEAGLTKYSLTGDDPTTRSREIASIDGVTAMVGPLCNECPDREEMFVIAGSSHGIAGRFTKESWDSLWSRE